jgi:hypothetical protein
VAPVPRAISFARTAVMDAATAHRQHPATWLIVFMIVNKRGVKRHNVHDRERCEVYFGLRVCFWPFYIAKSAIGPYFIGASSY